MRGTPVTMMLLVMMLVAVIRAMAAMIAGGRTAFVRMPGMYAIAVGHRGLLSLVDLT
jgi:hypothetical protein